MGPQFMAPAAYSDPMPPRLVVLHHSYDGNIRRVRFSLEARNWSRVKLRIPVEAGAIRIVSQGRTSDFPEAGPHWFYCSGRACASREFEIELKGEQPTEWLIQGVRYRLPTSAGPLLKARPDWATPIGDGDETIVTGRMQI